MMRTYRQGTISMLFTESMKDSFGFTDFQSSMVQRERERETGCFRKVEPGGRWV